MEDEEGIEQGLVGRSVPSLEATGPAAALVVTGSEPVVAGSTELNKPQPELHWDGADGEAPTNLPASNEPTRTTDLDQEAGAAQIILQARMAARREDQEEALESARPPPRDLTSADSIAQQITALERTRAMMQLHFPTTSTANLDAELVKLREALGPPVARLMVLQESQVRSATAVVTVEGALGFPAPIVQQDQAIAATATLGPKTGGNWWDPQVTTEQRGVA